METNEIMIGDWIYNKHHKKNIQITPYDFFTHGHLPSGNQYFIGEPELVSGRDLEPIPLTSEILLKNDFKYGGGYGYSFTNRKEMCGDGFEEEKVYINTDLNALIIYTAASTIRLPVKYIHELQHALKLCGIKKEIEL